MVLRHAADCGGNGALTLRLSVTCSGVQSAIRSRIFSLFVRIACALAGWAGVLMHLPHKFPALHSNVPVYLTALVLAAAAAENPTPLPVPSAAAATLSFGKTNGRQDESKDQARQQH